MQTETETTLSRLDARLAQGRALLGTHWRWFVLLAWLGFCIVLLYQGWTQIRGFGLGDTDDNMRMSQVRALLAGQDWYDLRQYKMNPPFGANIHWSRIVDLPLAGMILLLRPLIGGANAERTAVAIAPLLPLLPMMWALVLVTRRMVAPLAYPLAIIALLFAGSTLHMVVPTRIDHHGYQLALLAIGVVGITDPRLARGGVILGLASATSLSIGLEMIIYIALGGVAMVLFWVDNIDQRRRLAAFAASLGGGCAFGFAAFASYANRLPVCDALSPVWLSDALVGGALMLGLAMLRIERWQVRLTIALAAGIIVAAFHALVWPHCLTRLEGVSPEVSQLWLSHVREARPVYKHGWQVAALIAALPMSGLIGYGALAWMVRHDRERLRTVLAVAMLLIAATGLLLWQTRTGPAAQMLAIPGAVAMAWLLAPLAYASKNSVVRVLGTTLAVLFGLGGLIPLAIGYIPAEKQTSRGRAIARANDLCPTLWAMKPIAQQPKGIVLTDIDLAPRLITVTHHSSIAGPYHRNGDAILDVMHAFRESADEAHSIILRHHANYVLTCPDMSGTTVMMAEKPKGFYAQLTRNQVPTWLQPIALPKGNPLKLYRVTG